jgi:hypothetical protein
VCCQHCCSALQNHCVLKVHALLLLLLLLPFPAGSRRMLL